MRAASIRSPLMPIVLLLAAGVFTGAQLAKTAPLIPWYVAEAGLSLVAAGWLTALIGIFVAVAALPVGMTIARLGERRAFRAASLVLVAGGLALAFARAPILLFAARLLEGVGYVVLCIALPALLARIAPPAWRGPVLAIWSGFVPLGYAASDFISAAMLPVAPPGAFLLAMVAIYAVLALAGDAALHGTGDAPAGRAAAASAGGAPGLSICLIAAGFGAFVVQSIAFFTFLPTFVLAAPDVFWISPGLIVLTVPLGNVLAGILVRGRGVRFMAMLGCSAFVLASLAALWAFQPGAPALATVSAVVLAISTGVVASALFAAIPFVVRDPATLPVAIGLVSQAGGIATLFSPPLAAFVIEAAGWTGYAWLLAGVGAAGALCLVPLLRRRESAVSVAG